MRNGDFAVNNRFLRACRREPVDRVPVWFMRQAGRYDPEYRQIRETYTLLDICREPELCARVTRMPVDKLGVDAAILFSDIMVPVGAMGMSFSLQENVGPVMEQPLRTDEDVARLHAFDPEEALPYVLETIRYLAKALPVPLIGFAGGPFTLASYMIEGGPSRDYLRTKTMMLARPDLWHALMDKLSQAMSRYLRAQIQAGASAVQIFDSWVGSLSVHTFRGHVKPYVQRMLTDLAPLGVPVIYFGVHTGELLAEFAEAGATVVGVDWRTPLDRARQRVGTSVALQGNLDPVSLFAPPDALRREVETVLRLGTESPGYIFNLGHGVKPTTDLAQLQRVVEWVHAFEPQNQAARRTKEELG
ncbi:uroporphyrinogen decarboxylase [Alicyclobacillus acidocaldarius]|uniref:Uroporphyrinogen decarboxylase n=1 Tax=Alicyclobacillus acidocaldarius subsp. acidocaldarius (strain ATCC 27009 / DSM 446 / BCRC 14685 / JCM 5260 / KCTC 1825 / NBRC 15652 / NCIMB 11725 / NRRL B-14509 / 104-IA) TaxID=521098 RepID=C8WQF4_ALIAD|nr:uroporphyrinogen decarboxylase [Alicyclobacillus acidocaldarius]ACV59099.1 uroporphyrinogen decarboxylase [Alicyclobacillus acidocaldarius subsp. acidocaldarius DSM 446]